MNKYSGELMEPYQYQRHRVMNNDFSTSQLSQRSTNTLPNYSNQNYASFHNNDSYSPTSNYVASFSDKNTSSSPMEENRAHNDDSYVRQLNSSVVNKITNEVKKEFDSVDYESSFIYDVYPDKVTLQRMAEVIAKRMETMGLDQEVQTSNWHPSSAYNHGNYQSQYGYSCSNPSNCWFRYLIETIIFQELMERRHKRKTRY